MSLLQFILIVASVVFVIFALDMFQRKKVNILHVLVFVGGGLTVTFFALYPPLLDKFGRVFGVARGADLLIIITLIGIAYFYFELLNALTKQKFQFTRMVTAQALQSALPQLQAYQLTVSNDEKSDFCFLVRGYNESKSIGGVIDAIVQAGFTKIVVVNDGSTDTMQQVIEQKKSEYPNVCMIILSHLINRGGGAGNKTGFQFFRQYGELLKIKRVVGFDADGQMDVKDMQTFIKAIHTTGDQTDVYLGSRFVTGGGSSNMPWMRRIVLRGSKLVTYIFNRIWVSDPHNGYRVYKLAALQRMVITSDGMAYANEINDEIRRLNYTYQELPVHIHYTQYSLGKGQKNSNAWKILFELIYKKLFFK